jgi:dTDP-4-dehydrorhamnose reductase
MSGAARALVTGGGGQLADALVAAAPAGMAVDAPGIERLDIGDPAAVSAALDAIRPELVVNAAAYTAVDRAESEPDLADRVNHRAVSRLAEACASRGIRLVQVSTDYVFDGRSPVPYRPDDATNPQSVYGRTKRDGERAALAAPGALVVRTAWLYAPRAGNFMHTMLRLMAGRDEIRVVADQVGTPTLASGLAVAIWDLAARGVEGVHHWTDAGVASWYDFAVAIQEEALAAGIDAVARARVVPIRTIEYPTPAARPAMSILAKETTWTATRAPVVHWREALRSALREVKRGS